MKRILILAAFVLSSPLAIANPGNNGGGNGGCGVGQQTNGCGASSSPVTNTANGGKGGSATAYGGKGGAGGHGGNVAGSGNSHNANTNVNANRVANVNRSTNKQGQSQSSRNDNRSGAVAGAYNEGNNAAQSSSTSVSIGGDTYERSAPAIFGAEIPSVPTSCRLYLFGGGSNVNGAVTGSIPLGNDQTCLSIAAVNLMERVGGFSQVEKQKVVCKVEGLEGLPTCKALDEKPAVAASIVAAPSVHLAQAHPVDAPIPAVVERYTITADGAHQIN